MICVDVYGPAAAWKEAPLDLARPPVTEVAPRVGAAADPAAGASSLSSPPSSIMSIMSCRRSSSAAGCAEVSSAAGAAAWPVDAEWPDARLRRAADATAGRGPRPEPAREPSGEICARLAPSLRGCTGLPLCHRPASLPDAGSCVFALRVWRRHCSPRRRHETRRRAVLPGVLQLLRAPPRSVLVLQVGHVGTCGP